MSKKSPSMLTDCRQDFRAFALDAKNVVKSCKKSERKESILVDFLYSFIEVTLLALRAARKLKPEYPTDDHVKDYLHNLVEDVYSDVLRDMEQANTESSSED